jgi:hypothetical protein
MSDVIDRIRPALHRVRDWLRAIFKAAPPTIASAPLVQHDPSPPPAEPEPARQPPALLLLTFTPKPQPKATPRKRRASTPTQTRPDAETFAELLDGLESTFHTIQIPPIRGNWLPKADIRALHKLGIFIPSPWLLEIVPRPSLPPDMLLPMVASCKIASRKSDTEDRVHPRFAFAFKEPRLPASVEQIKGAAYRFGYCVELRADEHDKASAPRTFWVWAWVVIKPDGVLAVPRELRQVVHSIAHRRAVREKGRGCRTSSFQTRQWATPTCFRNDDHPEQDPGEHERFLLCIFRQLLLWWTTREERWSVGIRKDGKRATFSVDKQHTAAYFADRDKVVAVDGTAKKIIHFVRAHQRANGSMVKEHIRGLREFEWKGFSCAVTAPKFNGRVLTNSPLTPVEMERGASMDGHKTTEQVAELLADLEDRRTTLAA